MHCTCLQFLLPLTAHAALRLVLYKAQPVLCYGTRLNLLR